MPIFSRKNGFLGKKVFKFVLLGNNYCARISLEKH